MSTGNHSILQTTTLRQDTYVVHPIDLRITTCSIRPLVSSDEDTQIEIVEFINTVDEDDLMTANIIMRHVQVMHIGDSRCDLYTDLKLIQGRQFLFEVSCNLDSVVQISVAAVLFKVRQSTVPVDINHIRRAGQLFHDENIFSTPLPISS